MVVTRWAHGAEYLWTGPVPYGYWTGCPFVGITCGNKKDNEGDLTEGDRRPVSVLRGRTSGEV